jgi:hypothetical protein
VRYHRELLYAKGRDYIPMMLIGNHCDRTTARRVTYDKGRDLARQFGFKFIELYPTSPRNLTQAFFELIGDIIANEPPEPDIPIIIEPEMGTKSDSSSQNATQLSRSRSLRESLRDRLSPDTVKQIVRRRSFQDRGTVSLVQRLPDTNLLPDRQVTQVNR